MRSPHPAVISISPSGWAWFSQFLPRNYPVGHFSFVTLDDPKYVNENVHWALTSTVDANWVPITMLSHLAVRALFGLQSGMHHFVNVVLHALASIMLFAWLRRASGDVWPSAFVAFVFALHPLHVERP